MSVPRTKLPSTNNMVLFDEKQRIKRYENELKILQDYFPVRLNLYAKRKAHRIQVMAKELNFL